MFVATLRERNDTISCPESDEVVILSDVIAASPPGLLYRFQDLYTVGGKVGVQKQTYKPRDFCLK